ncbi:3',5'-cyclic adenosine monophosphate phosphodiesterase CpdA [Nocardia neocaledoniensis NBRC 108232]|uniref:3',5'-cyclic AMP phosphodiesterase CpdA n=1 Tax=Nocardia neocaledoniensis TaxID=236511 RepID=A0A317NRI9_9NOCA|nr:metallophosphoesterase [Nocardia neocaledoniensis]PWV77869.1 3',5'-cyclic AMP phosphodiesterase CpdA [Nocardia neocaledoniensis]GEM34582.1 3',5'-cyclic adenosine monophosphate phosphodiesterase CpdA [Nocardia neocaledoniensis NBRC 108232]
MILAAQLSDTHFDLTPRNTERVERVMAYLADLPRRPDVILVTGDITDSGKPEQYAEARLALRADIPVCLLPGNHDDRTTFRTELLGEPASDAPINSVHRVGPLTVLMLDSSVPGEPGGLLAEETHAWLADALAEAPDGPILIALHHPPRPVASPVVDVIALAEPARLAAVVAGDPRVIGVLTGHAHSPIATTFAGKPMITCPSTASVLGGEWEVTLPHKVMDYAPDPAVALHVIDETNTLTTHFRTVAMGGWLAEPPI